MVGSMVTQSPRRAYESSQFATNFALKPLNGQRLSRLAAPARLGIGENSHNLLPVSWPKEPS
jgi:hypothetical protein